MIFSYLLAEANDTASIATQFGVFGGVVAVMFYMLTRSDKREREDRDHFREQVIHGRSEIDAIRNDLIKEREAHAATRIEVGRLRVEAALIKERSDEREREHQTTKAEMRELQIKLDLLLMTPPIRIAK